MTTSGYPGCRRSGCGEERRVLGGVWGVRNSTGFHGPLKNP